MDMQLWAPLPLDARYLITPICCMHNLFTLISLLRYGMITDMCHINTFWSVMTAYATLVP